MGNIGLGELIVVGAVGFLVLASAGAVVFLPVKSQTPKKPPS